MAKGLESSEAISSIEPIEPSQAHYARLQKLSGIKRGSHARMDAVVYPPELYSDNSLLSARARPHYLTSTQVDFLIDALAFPANSSVQTRAELDYLLQLQKQRTPKQIERVLEIAKVGYWPVKNLLTTHKSYRKNLKHLFFELREVLGESCNAGKYPRTSILLQNIMNDMRLMEFAVKYKLLRARPYQLEPELKPLTTIGSPSFASGHTLWAYIQAYTLGELML